MEFPSLGEHCSKKSCNRLDFLPVKCDACQSIFCTDHMSYLSHMCPSAYKKDIQVPVCPLCNIPIPLKRGDPPDLAVGMHIDNDCQSDYGKSKKRVFVNKCSNKGCKIKEIVRVDCHECGLNYCLKHRHAVDHNCMGRDAAIRQKRIDAVVKKNNQTSSNQNGQSSSNFRNLQGTLSEDEALARALQASLIDDEQNQDSSSTNDGSRCTLS